MTEQVFQNHGTAKSVPLTSRSFCIFDGGSMTTTKSVILILSFVLYNVKRKESGEHKWGGGRAWSRF